MTKKVLHISFAYGGGVVTAIDSYVSNSDFAEHYLAADVGNAYASDSTSSFKGVYPIEFTIKGILRLRKYVAELDPDFLHLHSSFAGALGRVLFPFRRGLVYTPHCYSFEKQDVHILKRKLFFLIEFLLSIRPTRIAACSPREQHLACSANIYKILGYDPTDLLINYVPDFEKTSRITMPSPTVVMVGRLCPQKDPGFYLNVVQSFNTRYNIDCKFKWIGAGDSYWAERLQSYGIEVTGWLSHSEVRNLLSAASIYFHSASWEGCPMSILEAARINLPIVARSIPSVRSVGVTFVGADADECADMIYKTLNFEVDTDVQSRSINDLCSRENQISALNRLYRP